MSKKGKPIFVNRLPDFYEDLRKRHNDETANKIIEKWLNWTFNLDISNKIERFLQFGTTGLIPTDENYFDIFHELLGLYTNGFYYSTVVMSGVLCERMCYDILSRDNIKIGEYILNDVDMNILYKLPLTSIIDLIFCSGLIKKETRKFMIQINNKRNNYVHPKKKLEDAKNDCMYMIERIQNILFNEFEMKSY